ncbi:MAG: Maf family protein [Oscillospiraceae bacterium]|nr:Maf family protein [Oscillospiraceae bacterium]
MRMILASASPRRHELLKYIIPEFEIIPADIDETLPNHIPLNEAAEYLAVKKAAYIAKREPGNLVIGCDTVVIIDDVILGKPTDESDAVRMLRTLSGRSHRVITGVCIFGKGESMSFSALTEVSFYPLTDSEIKGYIKTGDPMDKAGSYGIQGAGAFLVSGIKGDFYNVMGLPIARLKRELELFKESKRAVF